MKIDLARSFDRHEAVSASDLDRLGDLSAAPRTWRPAEPPIATLPGWWVTAGYWDRDAVEDWFARPN